EDALDRAVLAEAPVQRDEHPLEFLLQQGVQILLRRIEGVRVDALLAQRGEHHAAALERHLALGRLAAQQHRDLAKTRSCFHFHFTSPTIRTSGTSSTPFVSRTVLLTSRISHSMSAALAAPSGLTMKLACFSDTRAPPRASALRPQDSMRRAAWSPGGLRNTLPALGSCNGCEAMRLASNSLMRARDASPSPFFSSNHAPTNHSSMSERRRQCR